MIKIMWGTAIEIFCYVRCDKQYILFKQKTWINPSTVKLFVSIFHSFEAGIDKMKNNIIFEIFSQIDIFE